MEDADYFEPFDETSDNGDWLDNYNRNLYSILGFNKIASEQFHFLIQSSFEPEQLLSIERLENGYTSTVVSLEESYWCMYRDNSISTVKTKISTAQLDSKIGDQVFSLVENSINQARRPQSGYLVLDGTVYKLSRNIGGMRRNASKHSPEGKSKTGRIVELLMAIVSFIKGNSRSDTQIMALVDSI